MLSASAIALAAAGFGQSAIAQSDESESDVSDTIRVTGIRSNIQDAIQTKRAAPNVVESLSSEGVGRLPDLNLAESLQRLPGVQINRSEDDRLGTISIRGLPGEFTQTTINGYYLATPDVENFSFGTVRAEVFSGIDVMKSLTAEMMTGGLSGTVNLRTGSPFDSGDTFQVAADATYESLAEETSLSGAAVFSRELVEDVLAVRGALGVKQQLFRIDTFQVNSYGTFGDVQAPNQIRTPVSNYDGLSVTGSFGVEYRPTEQLTFELLGFYNRYDFEELNNVNRFDRPDSVDLLSDPITETFTREGEELTFTTVNNVQFNDPRVIVDNRLFDQIYQTAAITGVATWEEGPWLAKGALHYTEASREDNFTGFQVRTNSDLSILIDTGLGDLGDVVFDLSAPIGQPVDLASLEAGSLNGNAARQLNGDGGQFFGGFRPDLEDDEEFSVHFDLARELQFGPVTGIQGGFVHRTKEQSRERYLENLLGAQIGNLSNDFYNFSSISGGDDYLGGEIGSFTAANSAELNAQAILAALTPVDFSQVAANGLNPERYLISESGLIAFRDNSALQSTYTNDIDITGGYLMAEYEQVLTDLLTLRGDVGVRHEATDRSTTIFGSVNGDNTGVEGLTTNTIDFDYSNTLPFANAILDVGEDVIIRAGYYESIRRPDVENFAVSDPDVPTSIAVDGAGDVFIDIPSEPLPAIESNNFDLSLEWYNRPGGIVALGYFRKDISSFAGLRTPCPADGGGFGFGPLSQSGSSCVTTTETTTASGQVVPVGANVGISQRQAGDSFTINGFEFNIAQDLSFLPAPWDGFGGSFNYAFIDFDPGDSSFRVTEISENAVNLIGYYETPDYGVRLAYNWRDEFLVGSSNASQGAARDVDSRFQLDGSAFWNVTDSTSLAFEAFNITDETLFEFDGVSSRPRRYSYFGRTFTFGLRHTF